MNLEQLGSISVNDVVYQGQVPMTFDPYSDEEFGVRLASHKLVQTQRITSVESAQDIGDYTHLRKMRLQSWRASWDKDSMMEIDLYTTLQRLYDNQEVFWIRLDDEMARNYGRLIPYYDNLAAGDYKPYFTPTHPIFPYGWSTGNPITFSQDDLIVASQYWVGDFSVSQETGLVLLSPYQREILKSTPVYFRYMWRAPVYISTWGLSPTDISQQFYQGQLEFTQVDQEYPSEIISVSAFGSINIAGHSTYTT